jgi:hypothetical protein
MVEPILYSAQTFALTNDSFWRDSCDLDGNPSD